MNRILNLAALLFLAAVGVGCLFGMYHHYQPPDEPIRMDALNTQYDDYNAAYPWVKYGRLVWSTNRGSEGKHFDLWTAEIELQDTQVVATPPEPFHPEWMSEGNEFGPVPLLSKTLEITGWVFASDRAGGQGGLDLYRATDHVESLAEFNSPANDAYWTWFEGAPAAYFASDRGGKGYDLYEMRDGKARRVPELSSDADDTAPHLFLYEGKVHVVFASNRSGNFDLWCSRRKGESWEKPRPVRGVNSPSAEFRPIVSSTWDSYTIFFSSNRPGGKGGFDLYYARFQSPF